MKKDPVEIFKDSIFEYEDYRSFIKDYFSLRKSIKSSFTQRYFIQRSGISSPAFFNYVINGKRNLSAKTLKRVSDALELNKIKAEYFENLVNFNQCDEHNEKSLFFDEMLRLRTRVKYVSVLSKQSNYFAHWYYPVLRELTVYADWNGSYKTLAALVYPKITSQQAQEAVEVMLDIKIIIKTGENYSFSNENIDDAKVSAFLKKHSRRDIFKRGVEVLDQLSPKERFATCSTFASNRKSYDKINELYAEFQEKAAKIIMDSEKEEIFQMTYGLFPISKKFN